MFGISLPELILLLLVVIIFVRPEDLPKFLRSAGRLYGKAKRMYKEIIGITNQVVKEMNSIASLDDLPQAGTPKKSAPEKPPVPLPADSSANAPAGLLNPPADLPANEPDALTKPEPDKNDQAPLT